MKPLLVFLLMNISLSSCSLFPDQRIAFTFTNALDSAIQIVTVHPIRNPELKVSCTDIAIEVVVEGITISVEYGYYTNGYPLEEEVFIVLDEEFLKRGA